MSSKTQWIIAGALAAIAFITGRYTAPTKTITKIQTVEVKSVATNTEQDDNKVETIDKKPDGETITVIKDDDKTNTQTKELDTVKQRTTTVTLRDTGLRASALFGVSASNLTTPIYGASITKTILGPITVGAWGLSNATFGVSVGLSF